MDSVVCVEIQPHDGLVVMWMDAWKMRSMCARIACRSKCSAVAGEMQVYGDAAIFYSFDLYELEQGGQRSTSSGRVAEVFVRRNGLSGSSTQLSA